MPETSQVSRAYNVTAILCLPFMAQVMILPMINVLYVYISTFRGMCVSPSMAVICSSLMSCFPGTLLRYFLNYFETVPVAPVITGITFTFHMRCTSIVNLKIFRLLS
jgi:hypothetical protein